MVLEGTLTKPWKCEGRWKVGLSSRTRKEPRATQNFLVATFLEVERMCEIQFNTSVLVNAHSIYNVLSLRYTTNIKLGDPVANKGS